MRGAAQVSVHRAWLGWQRSAAVHCVVVHRSIWVGGSPATRSLLAKYAEGTGQGICLLGSLGSSGSRFWTYDWLSLCVPCECVCVCTRVHVCVWVCEKGGQEGEKAGGGGGGGRG